MKKVILTTNKLLRLENNWWYHSLYFLLSPLMLADVCVCTQSIRSSRERHTIGVIEPIMVVMVVVVTILLAVFGQMRKLRQLVADQLLFLRWHVIDGHLLDGDRRQRLKTASEFGVHCYYAVSYMPQNNRHRVIKVNLDWWSRKENYFVWVTEWLSNKKNYIDSGKG